MISVMGQILLPQVDLLHVALAVPQFDSCSATPKTCKGSQIRGGFLVESPLILTRVFMIFGYFAVAVKMFPCRFP
jgi:hypothetical protein